MEIAELLKITVDIKASDLHLVVENSPLWRVDGNLVTMEGYTEKLTMESNFDLVTALMSKKQKELFDANREIDFSYATADGYRFRVNAYYTRQTVSAALRLIPPTVPSFDDLKLPPIYRSFASLHQGLILVTGPTGHGKSSTLAALVRLINETRSCHVLTIEDPIEFVHSPIKSVISQRELHDDTHSWQVALRSALREDPDVVLVGEMRDYETIAAALTVAETGHLVLATLHTNSAAQTIDRIIDVFPDNQQPQVRMQLSNSLEAVIAQRLIPAITGGRVPASEILLATSAVKNTIREGKTHQIDNIIQTSGEVEMQSLEKSLAGLVQKGIVAIDVAEAYALRPEELKRYAKY